MIRNKRRAGWASVLAALLMIQCAGCSGNQGSSDAGQNGNSPAGDSELSETSDKDAVTDNAVDGSKEEKKRAVPLTDEQKEDAANKGISEYRFCVDNTEITKEINELVTNYCDGMMEEDYNKCYDTFPPFYKRAVAEENKKLGLSDKECMHEIKNSLTEEFGDDMYMYAVLGNIMQISDEPMAEVEAGMSKSFNEEIKLDDLYKAYLTYYIKGSKDKTSYDIEFMIPVIDGKSYLYDDYYEVTAEEETVPQPDVSEEKKEPEVTEAAGEAKVSETEK